MFQENSIETCILSRVKQIISPGWMHETSARTWCTGKTQRDRVESEVGGGIGMGNTCKPMAVSFQCMIKSTTIKKKMQCVVALRLKAQILTSWRLVPANIAIYFIKPAKRACKVSLLAQLQEQSQVQHPVTTVIFYLLEASHKYCLHSRGTDDTKL